VVSIGNDFPGHSSKALGYSLEFFRGLSANPGRQARNTSIKTRFLKNFATHFGREAQIFPSSAPMGNQDEAEERPDPMSGKVAAWCALYDEHAESVWRLVARLIGPTRAEVADIVQETFLAAARSFDQFDKSRGTPRAWLCGIARRQTAIHFRRQQRQQRLLTGEGRPADERERIVDWLERRQETPPDVLTRAETVDAVRVALVSLTDPHAAVLIARYFDGVDVEQIARDEDCGTSAIRSRLARARQAFRRAFLALQPCAADADATRQQP
jgi:RNA polymerase sigma-70 factor (ECF subfamily)